MLAVADEKELHLLEFQDRPMLSSRIARLCKRHAAVLFHRKNPVIDQLEAELGEYFDGMRTRFAVPLDIGGTEHQERVWCGLLEVPYGATWSYQELAEYVGKPTGVRAVARAVADNRVAILVPCHRIVGSDGALTGYAGGIWRKRSLLRVEGPTDQPAR